MESKTPFDQRAETRYRTELKARVSTADVTDEALILNLSSCGLQMQCSGDLVSALLPNIQRPDPRAPLVLGVSFEVETSGRQKALIELQCQIIYTRRLAQDRFLIGCQFTGFNSDCGADLQDYLLNFGEPI